MATKTLDFRALKRPFLRLVIDNEEETIIRVTTPTADMVEDFRANLPELLEVLKGNGAEQKIALYDMAAKLISCNLDAVDVTAKTLTDEYDWSVSDLTVFFTAYTEFLEEIESAKN